MFCALWRSTDCLYIHWAPTSSSGKTLENREITEIQWQIDLISSGHPPALLCQCSLYLNDSPFLTRFIHFLVLMSCCHASPYINKFSNLFIMYYFDHIYIHIYTKIDIFVFCTYKFIWILYTYAFEKHFDFKIHQNCPVYT